MKDRKQFTREEKEQFLQIALKHFKKANFPFLKPDDDEYDDEEFEIREADNITKNLLIVFYISRFNIAGKITFYDQLISFNLESFDAEILDSTRDYDSNFDNTMIFYIQIIKDCMELYNRCDIFKHKTEVPLNILRSGKVENFLDSESNS